MDPHERMKTGTLLALAFVGVWCIMSSNHPYMCWHPSQFINGACVGLIHHCTSNQTKGSHPYWLNISPTMDPHGWEITGTFSLWIGWCVMYNKIQPSIHTSVDTPLKSYFGACMGLLYHCTSNQARESHSYWPHITPRMDQHGWKKTGTLLDTILDSVWCIMGSNHPYKYWHPSQFINGYLGEVDPPLYKQPSKGVTSILTTNYPKDLLWVDGWKLRPFYLLLRMVWGVSWAPTIHTGLDTTLSSSICSWVGLIHHSTSNKARW